jgi:hypothetical protein
VGEPNQWADSYENGLFIWNIATFDLVSSKLGKVGKATELRILLLLAHRLDGPVIPDASAARMTGVIVASVRRIRFRP